VLNIKAIVTMYSQVVHQPSGIRRFWFGVSLLSPLRPILRNGNPLLKFLGNALTGERIPASYHTSYVGNRPAENALPNLSATAVVPGSWAYEQRGQPNEEADCDRSCRCQEDSSYEKGSRSDTVAKGMMKVHATH